MGTLEVEALAVAVDPPHVVMVMRLSCHRGQQRQHHQSRTHVEGISLTAALSHSCLGLNASEPVVVQMFCIQERCVISHRTNPKSLDILRWTLRQSTDKVSSERRVHLKRQHLESTCSSDIYLMPYMTLESAVICYTSNCSACILCIVII